MTPRERIRGVFDRHGRKMARYLTGSIAATLVSTLTFMATFGWALLGSKGAALAASATGAVVNYFLNRHWTWGRRGRAKFRSELLPYWTTVVLTAVAAAVVTGLVNAGVHHFTDDRALRTLLNTVAYLSTYGVSFLLKYRIFDRLFGDGPSRSVDLVAAERSREPSAA